jgi:hypothetical protein
MCVTVKFHGRLLHTCGELREALGLPSLVRHPLYTSDPEDGDCLCGVAIDEVLARAQVPTWSHDEFGDFRIPAVTPEGC